MVSQTEIIFRPIFCLVHARLTLLQYIFHVSFEKEMSFFSSSLLLLVPVLRLDKTFYIFSRPVKQNIIGNKKQQQQQNKKTGGKCLSSRKS